jgi:DUF971 family protein
LSAEAFKIRKADINDERQALEILWGDGHESAFPLPYLRSECPCAGCRTAREEVRSNPFRVIGANERPPSSEVADVEAVGRYGMKITWKDGHSTGIYTFEYLREICPCEACRAARKGEEAPYVHGIYIPKG